MFASEDGNPRYSIVVPFHNERDSAHELYQELSGVMTGRYEPVEFIFVDDQGYGDYTLRYSSVSGMR